jgi:hypothetical protein
LATLNASAFLLLDQKKVTKEKIKADYIRLSLVVGR